MSGSVLTLSTIPEVQARLDQVRAEGGSIGLVPTMGALHEGHLSLIRAAKADNDLVVVSIFVNPTQFGPSEDFSKYPRELKTDRTLAAEAGADVIFAPSAEEMYAGDHSTWVEVDALTDGLCGRSRPGHFRGVCTVVTKLFAICEPHRAYFGEKDAQQLAVIQRMVRDLNLRVHVVPCPIVREEDGLAMSSRNALLTAEGRAQAPVLYGALRAAVAAVEAGERDSAGLMGVIRRTLAKAPLASVDYIEVVRAEDLTPLTELRGDCLVALAVRFGDVRLIDNVRMTV